MSSKLVVTIVVFSVVMLVFIYFITAGQKPDPSVVQFSAQDVDRPKAEPTQLFANLGEIKVTDVKQQDFILKNAGTKSLQILGVSSSCGCTTGQIIYKDNESKIYSMHAQGEYVTDIAPGDTAIIRLVYRPATMPVYGLVEREVYVTTN